MKKQILFLHSAGPQGLHEGSDDFVRFLQKALSAEYDLHCPKMPAPEAPNYIAWKNQLVKEVSNLPEGSILIGHSLGGSVLLKYLSEETPDKSFSSLFLVAVPYWGGDTDWQYSEFSLQKDFATKLPSINHIFIYHSRDDQVVPQTHVNLYAEKLPQAIVRELDNRGHVFEAGSPEIVADLRM